MLTSCILVLLILTAPLSATADVLPEKTTTGDFAQQGRFTIYGTVDDIFSRPDIDATVWVRMPGDSGDVIVLIGCDPGKFGGPPGTNIHNVCAELAIGSDICLEGRMIFHSAGFTGYYAEDVCPPLCATVVEDPECAVTPGCVLATDFEDGTTCAFDFAR